nr:MAG TPA: hypothetical protein [Caudoviricetes sp.]
MDSSNESRLVLLAWLVLVVDSSNAVYLVVLVMSNVLVVVCV